MNLNNIEGISNGDDIKKMDEELKKQGKAGIVYDPSGMMNGESNEAPPVNLPNVNSILDKVYEILQYMDDNNMIKLKNEDDKKYIKKMEERFPAFSDRYYSLFQKIISGDDLTHLFSMLAEIEKIKSGSKTIEDAEKDLGQQLAQQYIYPKVPNSKPKNKTKTKKKKNRRKR